MSTLPPTQCDCCAQSPPAVLRSHARGGIFVCLRCHLNEGGCCWVYMGDLRRATKSETNPHHQDGATRDSVASAHGLHGASQ